MTDPLTAIVKRHHETGCYGHAHLRMRREDFETYPKQPRRDDFGFPPSPLVSLMSIPVVVDDGLGEGVWQLVDNSTREVLFVGSVSTAAEPPAEGGKSNALTDSPRLPEE